jgi:NAD(P)-dependent dehydrogenase (short-subunit alcohol dehydrogenase family)
MVRARARHVAARLGQWVSKGALDIFTLHLARQLGSRGITANSVAPGIVDTDVNAGWLRGNPDAQAREVRLHRSMIAGAGRLSRENVSRWCRPRLMRNGRTAKPEYCRFDGLSS